MPARTMSVVTVVLTVAAACSAVETVGAPEPKIQVALLLDNSGSMNGLIDQARTQLWTFVNEFATSRKGGRAPAIEVALYTYGNPPPTQLVPLTDDLDLVSEKLFAVMISGGDEYCGQVIRTAVEGLAWSDSPADLKVIFIAGNEPFTQGPIDYHDACKAAIAKGILVNTIHCGDEAAGINGKWKDGALLAEGTYLCINQNKAIPHVEAPQDAEIVRLGGQLSETYVPYGAAGDEGRKRQEEQNANAAGVSLETHVQRTVAQSQAQYRNATWDLVDAVEQGKVEVEGVKTEHLPEPMQTMTVEERRAFVETTAKRRAELQKQIRDLNEARRRYVAAELEKLQGDDDSLDTAMIKTLRAQAADRDFTFAE